jgi:hypothetical protein
MPGPGYYVPSGRYYGANPTPAGLEILQDTTALEQRSTLLRQRDPIAPTSIRLDATTPPTEVATYYGAAMGFAADADDIIYVTWAIPPWVDATKDLKLVTSYTMSTSAAGTVRWNMEYKSIADGGLFLPTGAYETAVEDAFTACATLNLLTKITGTNLKIATTKYAVGDIVVAKLWRDVDDTHTGAFEVHALYLQEAA